MTAELGSDANFRALFTPQLQYVRDLFKAQGHELRIAGKPDHHPTPNVRTASGQGGGLKAGRCGTC